MPRRLARAVNPGSREECRLRAIRLLAIKERTRAELVRALGRRGFAPQVVREVVGSLARRGLLNDEAVARTHVSARAGRFGRGRIRAELRARGLPEETITRVLGGWPAEDETHALEAEFRRLWDRSEDLPFEKRRRKVAAALSRRGFSLEDIFEMMKDCEIE